MSTPSLTESVIASMSGSLVPPLYSYVLFSTPGTTFDIELFNNNGQTIAFLTGCTLSAASATTLRAACNSNTLFDTAVGAVIRPVADIYYNNAGQNDGTIAGGLSPSASSIGKFSAGVATGISWGS